MKEAKKIKRDRRLSNAVIDSDRVQGLPLKLRLLYIDMIRDADDQGFVDNVEQLRKINNVRPSELSKLFENGLIISTCYDNVYLICDWWKHQKKAFRDFHPSIYENALYEIAKSTEHCKINVSDWLPVDISTVSTISTKDIKTNTSTSNSILGIEIDEKTERRILDAWNVQDCTINISTIRTKERRNRQTALVISKYGLDKLLDQINGMSEHAYFRKQITGDKVKYDWFIETDTFQKVIDGEYYEEY